MSGEHGEQPGGWEQKMARLSDLYKNKELKSGIVMVRLVRKGQKVSASPELVRIEQDKLGRLGFADKEIGKFEPLREDKHDFEIAQP